MRSKSTALKVKGFIEGAAVISERELENGTFEIVLELPLTGPAGLTRYLSE